MKKEKTEYYTKEEIDEGFGLKGIGEMVYEQFHLDEKIKNEEKEDNKKN